MTKIVASLIERIKKEIQTPKGLLAELKKGKMPDTKEMSDIAWNQYRGEEGPFSPDYVTENFSDILKNVISLEYSLYKVYVDEIFRNSINIFLNEKFEIKDEYPNLQEYFSEMKENYRVRNLDNFSESVGEISFEIFPVMRYIADSIRQGAVSRAGHSLENHLETLFNIIGIRYAKQVQLELGARVDFLLPNTTVFRKDPTNSIFIACQTTLKDRFRISNTKIPAHLNVRKYIATATGVGIITDRDVTDITENKLAEIHRDNFKLIVFDEVKEKWPDNNTVMSYSYFVTREYPAFSSLW